VRKAWRKGSSSRKIYTQPATSEMTAEGGINFYRNQEDIRFDGV